MIHIRPGSQVLNIITMLSVVGEIPTKSIHLFGNERVYKVLIHKLTTPQTFRNSETGEEMTVWLLTVTGKGERKTVRFYKKGLPILDWIGARGYYLSAFWNHDFPNDNSHRERNHRVAESVTMCMRAGLEYRPYKLPELQNSRMLSVIPEYPVLYLAKEMKKTGEYEMSKTQFTRMTGTVFTSGQCFAVYNTRNAVMKWSGMGEYKALHNLVELIRLNSGVPGIDSAILFGESEQVALETILESDKSRRQEFRFDSIYHNVHFIPLNEFGIRQLSIMMLPNWNEQLLDILFEPETRSYNKGIYEYDAFIDGAYVLSHLDCNIARLIRFREAVTSPNGGRYEVLCYPHQVLFLREYLGPNVSIKSIDMDSVEEELGQERRNIFDG